MCKHFFLISHGDRNTPSVRLCPITSHGTAFIQANISISLSLNGPVYQGISGAGAFSGFLFIGAKFTALKNSLQNLFAKHHARMEAKAKSTTSGAGDWNSKIINGGHNIYRYAGYISYSYEKQFYITNDLGDKAYFEDLLFDLFEKTSAYEKLVEAQKDNGYIDIYFSVANYKEPDINRSTGEVIDSKRGDTQNYGAIGVTNGAHQDVPGPIYSKMFEGSKLGRTSISIRYNLDYIDALNDLANMEKTFENMKKFELTLEMALYTLMHEVNAQAIRDVNGTSLTAQQEHGLFNHDHCEQNGSPAYIRIPLDGKSQSSKDKIEVQRIVRQYMSQWKK